MYAPGSPVTQLIQLLCVSKQHKNTGLFNNYHEFTEMINKHAFTINI